MDVTNFLIALLPIVLLILLLGVFNIAAHKAAPITLIVTAIIAILNWHLPVGNAVGAVIEGSAIGLWPIMIVIVAAIFSYNLAKKTGAMDKITTILESITDEKPVQVLILAWGFGGFLEAVAGYGTAVAIPAGILAALGFNPLFAAIISLIANTVPTAFGAIGIPVSTLADMTGLDPNILSSVVALQLTPFIIMIPFVLVAITGGIKVVKDHWFIALMAGVSFAIPHYLVARYLGPQLPALIGSLVSLATVITTAKLQNRENQKSFGAKFMWEAWSPYIIILIVILAASSLVPPIHTLLMKVTSEYTFVEGGKAVHFKWIATPGALIVIATIIYGFIAKVKFGEVVKTFVDTTIQLGKSFPTVLSIVALAKVMSYAGMIHDISTGIVTIAGSVFPFISPMLGTLGTFVTGSDTSSNILFGELQRSIAANLSQNEFMQYWIAAANTAGATAGKMISPQSIAVATSATGLVGMEGKIFSKTVKFCLSYVGILGVFVGIVSLFIR